MIFTSFSHACIYLKWATLFKPCGFFFWICLFVNNFDGWEKLDGRLSLCRAMIDTQALIDGANPFNPIIMIGCEGGSEETVS